MLRNDLTTLGASGRCTAEHVAVAREAKKRSSQASRHSSRGGSSLPGWVWGLLGLGAGLFIALLVYLQHSAPNNTAAIADLFRSHESDTASRPTGHRPMPNDEPAHPRFEFYKLLPDQEVEVPAPEPSTAPSPAKSSPAANNRDGAERPRQQPPAIEMMPLRSARVANGNYLLQAGSFRNVNEADQLKANLALLGIEASVQNVELATGETWHRVRIGPFSDRRHLTEIRKRLQANNIHAIVLKRGG